MSPSQRLAIGALAMTGFLPVFGQRPSRESDEAFARGVKLQQAGDLTGASRAYEAALKLSPDRIDALSNLGLALAGLRQYDRALQTFGRALQIDPQQPSVLFNIGITYLQAGQAEKAGQRLAEVVKLQGDNYLAHHFLGLSLLKQGRSGEGIAELENVVQTHPEDTDAAYTLGSAYIASKQLEKAHTLIESVVANRHTAEAHLITGSYYLAAKDYRRAVVELRLAQELNPALSELGNTLGDAYARTGSRDLAVQLFETRLKSAPNDFEALAFLGWLYLDSDRVKEAGKLLEHAHKLKPEDSEVIFQLARVARAQEHFNEATELLERVIAANPKHTRAHVLLAETYFRLKRTADGKRERQIVDRLNAEHPAKP
jgi:tetratricopeptide (TPR) repeat protein